MKTVLVYGDSNTFGQKNWPYLDDHPRLDYEARWTSIVDDELGRDVRVIAEGLPGRTAGNVQHGDDSFRNGQAYFTTIFASHEPIDIVMIALGTNDCQARYKRTAKQIYDDLCWYTACVKLQHNSVYPMPRMMFLSPPLFDVDEENKYFAGRLLLRNELVSLMVGNESELDVVRLDDIDTSHDGLHLSAKGHRQVADIVVQALRKEIERGASQ